MILDGRSVGAGEPCFVIAEAGVNHDGDPARAHALVDAAADAGADAVKFQTFDAAEIAVAEAPSAAYQRSAPGAPTSQTELLRPLQLATTAYRELFDHCRERRITFLSTPFDTGSADLLVDLGVAALKVPSGELTNLPLLADLAGRGLPLIVSTGMADLDEVRAAVDVVRRAGCDDFVLLHCVSSYPAPDEAVNLRAMATMRSAFDVPVGYSDHTTGIAVALAAVALEACLVEKHLTLDRTLPGPDHRASLEPDELADLVAGIRRVEAALGDGRKVRAACEDDVAAVARRSLVTTRALPAGHLLVDDDLAARRPGTGLPPDRRDEVVGRRLARGLAEGTTLVATDLE